MIIDDLERMAVWGLQPCKPGYESTVCFVQSVSGLQLEPTLHARLSVMLPCVLLFIVLPLLKHLPWLYLYLFNFALCCAQETMVLFSLEIALYSSWNIFLSTKLLPRDMSVCPLPSPSWGKILPDFVCWIVEKNPFPPLKLSSVLAKGPVKSQEIKVILTTLDVPCPSARNSKLDTHLVQKYFPLHWKHFVFGHFVFN